jgi:hypothetical protein
MPGATEVDQLALSVVDDEAEAEHAERRGGDHEEVDRGDDLAMVAEDRSPALTRRWIGWTRGMERETLCSAVQRGAATSSASTI